MCTGENSPTLPVSFTVARESGSLESAVNRPSSDCTAAAKFGCTLKSAKSIVPRVTTTSRMRTGIPDSWRPGRGRERPWRAPSPPSSQLPSRLGARPAFFLRVAVASFAPSPRSPRRAPPQCPRGRTRRPHSRCRSSRRSHARTDARCGPDRCAAHRATWRSPRVTPRLAQN